MLRAIQLLVVVLMLGVGLEAQAEQWTFTTIDVPGATFTIANGITPGGDIVGPYVSADGHTHGYVLRKGP